MLSLQKQKSLPNFSSKYLAVCGTEFIYSLIQSHKILSLTSLVSKHCTQQSGAKGEKMRKDNKRRRKKQSCIQEISGSNLIKGAGFTSDLCL
jgi:hypothetical protein